MSLISLSLSSCGLFSKTEKEAIKGSPYPPLPVSVLDEDYFHTPVGDIAGHYPKGWLRVDLSTIPMENVLSVYTDSSRQRALVLTEIPSTAEFRRNVERDGLIALADQSFASKNRLRPGTLAITTAPDIYTLRNKLIASYEYAELSPDSTSRKQHRVALFTTGAKFYELGMIELAQPRSPTQHTENFRLLESVIGTLEGVAQVRGIADTVSERF